MNRELEAKTRALAGWKGYITNLEAPTADYVIGAYHQLWQFEKGVSHVQERPDHTVQIQAGDRALTAADPLPDDVQAILAKVHDRDHRTKWPKSGRISELRGGWARVRSTMGRCWRSIAWNPPLWRVVGAHAATDGALPGNTAPADPNTGHQPRQRPQAGPPAAAPHATQSPCTPAECQMARASAGS